MELAKACGWDFDEGYLFSDMTLKREKMEFPSLSDSQRSWKHGKWQQTLGQTLRKQVCMLRKLLSLSEQEGQSLRCRRETSF